MTLAAVNLTPVAAVPAGFMAVADAAARLSRSERDIRRQCERWAPLGLARKIDGVWYVSKHADPRLGTDVETAAGRDRKQLAELAREGHSAKSIQQAEAIRDRIVLPWRDGEIAGRNDEERATRFINQCQADGTLQALGIDHLSSRTLRQWETDYGRSGLRGLVRRPYPERGASGFGEFAQAMFVEVMRTGHGITVRSALDQVIGYTLQKKLRDDPAWRVPALRTAQEWWKRSIHPAAKTLIAKGPHKMRALTIPKMVRDPRIDYAAGELLIGDERTFDFMCREYGERGWQRFRPKLTAWQDGVSGLFTGWYIGKRANTDTILSTLGQSILETKTVPRVAKIDHGAGYKNVGGPPQRNRKWDPYDAKRIETPCERLGIKVSYAIVRYPWSKPIESGFAGLKEFDRFQVGFVGGSPSERPFDAEKWSKMNIFDLPIIEQIREDFAAWLKARQEDPRRSFVTQGLSARQAFQQFYTTRPRRVDKDTLDIVCRKLVGPTRIGRDGVRHQRLRYGTFDEAVWRIQGREVYMLVDAIDRDSVILCDADGGPLLMNGPDGRREFIVAHVDRPLGYKAEEVRERIAFQRRCEKTVKQYAPSRDYLLKTPAQQIAERRRLAAVARQIPDKRLPPASEVVSVELVRPDIAAAAAEVRRAAGAETLRRLSGMNSAAEAMNRPRPITLADLNGRAEAEPAEDPPARRITLQELSQLVEADCNAP